MFYLILIIRWKKGGGKLEKRGEGNVRIFGTFYRDPSIFSAIVRLSLRDYFNPTIIHLFIKRSDFILQAYTLRWNRNKWPPKMMRNSEGQTIRFDSIHNFIQLSRRSRLLRRRIVQSYNSLLSLRVEFIFDLEKVKEIIREFRFFVVCDR